MAFSPLMIIDNFNVGTISRRPDETDTVLIVNGDGILPFAVIAERFERHPIAREIGQRLDGIQSHEAAEGNSLNVPELAAGLFAEDLLCFGAAERNDHKTIVFLIAEYVKRNRGMYSRI